MQKINFIQNPLYELTDIGIAKLFMDSFKDELIFCADTADWYYWNDKFWVKDSKEGGKRYEMIKELSEAKNIYPSFAKIAYDEGFNDIGKSFEMVARVEETHHKMLQYLGNLYKCHSMYKRDHVTKWKCSNCGYVAEAKESYKICPLCSLQQGYVIINMEDTDSE